MMCWRKKLREMRTKSGRDHQSLAAEEALLVARISYEDTLALKPLVQEIGAEHRRLQQENHFSEKIRRAYFEGN